MKTHDTYPPGWDTRITPEIYNPVLWDEDEYKSYAKMGVVRGNNGYVQLLQTETRSMLPKIIATLRWVEFGEPSKEMGRLVGLSGHGYKAMETDIEGRQPQFHTYNYLLQFLKENQIALGIREQILDLLTMPDLFEQKNPAEEEEYETPVTLLQLIEDVRNGTDQTLNASHVSAFYHRIGYDIGHPEFLLEFPSFWANIHNREHVGTVPKALEILHIVDTLYSGQSPEQEQMHALRFAEGKQLWVEAKKHQYRERRIEKPLAEFLSAAEMHLAEHWEWIPEDEESAWPMTFTALALRECFGIEDLASQRLVQSELISWDEIADTASIIIAPDRLEQFEKDWRTAYSEEQDRYGFPNDAVAAMEGQGFSYKDVADILDVNMDESKRKKKEDEREQRDRPESQIRNIMLFNRQSGQVAIEGLLRVIARDENHYQELRMLYESERERYYRRQGERLHGDGLHMRILCELGNVTTRQLASKYHPEGENASAASVRKFETDIIQKVERQEITHPDITFEKLVLDLEEIIRAQAQKTNAALDKFDDFPEGLKDFTAVDQMATNSIKGMRGGGAAMVSERMRDRARNNSDWLRPDLITNMSGRIFVPTLPSVRLMSISVADLSLDEDGAVVRNWYERFPEQLGIGCADFSKGQFYKSPMTRVLCTMIAAGDANLIQFFKNRTSGITPTLGTALLRRIEEKGCLEDDWQRVRKIMVDSGNTGLTMSHELGKLLFHNGQDVQAALTALAPGLKKKNIEAHPINLKGLTLEEIATSLAASADAEQPPHNQHPS